MNLYIVATPIGNLEDITLRALETLKNVDIIVCEDTRVSKKLLEKYEIKTKLISYHQHSGQSKVDLIIDFLKQGQDVAVITDAGTPGISDPGGKLVDEAVRVLGEDLKVIPIPGASAVISALSVSGFATDKFLFLGFMPNKKGKETMMRLAANTKETTIFYESTHRILKTLEALKDFLEENRRLIVCRELTKKFETVYRGNINQIINKLKNDTTKGEFVVVIENKK